MNYKWIVLGVATLAQFATSFVTQGIGPLIVLWQETLVHIADAEMVGIYRMKRFFP